MKKLKSKKKCISTLLSVLMVGSVLTASAWAQKIPTDPLNGKPPAGSKVSVKDLDYQVKYQRAFEAVMWSMPMIDMYGINNACLEVGGAPNVILAWSQGAKPYFESMTSNNTSPYTVAMTDLRKGPVVLEVPASTKVAGLFGQIVDYWFDTIADIGPIGIDKGKGAKVLLTPPGYKDKIPDGYIEVKSCFRPGFAFRSLPTPDGTPADAVALGKKLKMYYLSELPNPKPNKFVDPLNIRWSTLPKYDERWFEDLYDVINVEPVNPRDKVMMGMLKSLGIEKGKPYVKPDAKTLKAMRAATTDAYHYMHGLVMKTTPDWLWWPNRQWRNSLLTDPNRSFTWETDNMVDYTNRARHPWHYATYLPKHLEKNPTTMYIDTPFDEDGKLLEAGKTYSLTVPKDVPVSNFWSLIVYDRETMSFIYSPEMLPGLSSRDLHKMKINADGSATIYLGPKAPKGLKSNWLPTSGKQPFLMFRFFGVKDGFMDKSFVLPDVKLVK